MNIKKLTNGVLEQIKLNESKVNSIAFHKLISLTVGTNPRNNLSNYLTPNTRYNQLFPGIIQHTVWVSTYFSKKNFFIPHVIFMKFNKSAKTKTYIHEITATALNII